MITIFMEYRIKPEKREQYLEYMEQMPEDIERMGAHEYRFYEGVDQPNLFVETFEVHSKDNYIACKEKRTSDERLASYVLGGAEKIHLWAFEQINIKNR